MIRCLGLNTNVTAITIDMTYGVAKVLRPNLCSIIPPCIALVQ